MSAGQMTTGPADAEIPPRAVFETRDFYLACFLKCSGYDLIDLRATGRRRVGNANPRILRRKNRIALPGDAGDELTAAIRSYEQQRDNEALQEFVRPFAERFKVSAAAMRIRLERLGLLRREVPRQRSLAVGT